MQKKKSTNTASEYEPLYLSRREEGCLFHQSFSSVHEGQSDVQFY